MGQSEGQIDLSACYKDMLVKKAKPVRRKKARKLPDFYARMRKIFGKKKLAVSSAELLRWDREE
jgi:hypothetical protein